MNRARSLFLLAALVFSLCACGQRQAEGSESLIRRIESRDGLHTREYAAQIGLGSRSCALVNLDD